MKHHAATVQPIRFVTSRSRASSWRQSNAETTIDSSPTTLVVRWYAPPLAAACDYVLLNPVAAGLVRCFDEWAWSGDGRLEPRPLKDNRYELVTRL